MNIRQIWRYIQSTALSADSIIGTIYNLHFITKLKDRCYLCYKFRISNSFGSWFPAVNTCMSYTRHNIKSKLHDPLKWGIIKAQLQWILLEDNLKNAHSENFCILQVIYIQSCNQCSYIHIWLNLNLTTMWIHTHAREQGEQALLELLYSNIYASLMYQFLTVYKL